MANPSKTHASIQVRRHWHRTWVLLLTLTLLWSQMLGLAHRVRHPPAGGVTHEFNQPQSYRQALVPATVGISLLEHLRSSAPADGSCQLYDQFGLADTLPALPLLALLQAQPVWFAPTVAVHFVSSICTHYQSRAPPRVS